LNVFVGVTVIKEIAGLLVLLIALKEGIEPTPLEAIPIDGLLVVHVKLVAFPIILTVPVGALLQKT
jgi:hypothetical protein